jgi:hypothetical protein
MYTLDSSSTACAQLCSQVAVVLLHTGTQLVCIMHATATTGYRAGDTEPAERGAGLTVADLDGTVAAGSLLRDSGLPLA